MPSLTDEEIEEMSKHQHIKRGSVTIATPEGALDDGKFRFSWKALWSFTGPGFLMSIAYLDPGNIESDLQAGAAAGYTLMWVLWWSTVIGLFLQLLGARLGVVTGRDLGQTCRQKYPASIRYTLWIMMEIAIISSDIQEVIGSAMAINILSNKMIPLWGGALITGVDTFTFLLLESYGLRKLEAFFAVLITTLSITFGWMWIAHHPDDLATLKGTLIPSIAGKEGSTERSEATEQAVGILGAVIMPHNLYLHSSLVLSRKVKETFTAKREANIYNGIESSIALLISFFVNMFVITVFAKGFFANTGENPEYQECNVEATGHTWHPSHTYSNCTGDECICAGGNIDLISAGCCLEKSFKSNNLKYVWAVGLLAAGQSSTMTGTYAGQFVMEGFLNLKMPPWKRVLITRSFAMVPTVLVAAFANPHILGSLNEWMNVLQSIQLPFAMLPLLHFTSMPSIMGPFTNGLVAKTAGWSLALVVILINLYQVFQTPIPEVCTGGQEANHTNYTNHTFEPKSCHTHWAILVPIIVVAGMYLTFVSWLLVGPLLRFKWNPIRNWYHETPRGEEGPLCFMPLDSRKQRYAAGGKSTERQALIQEG